MDIIKELEKLRREHYWNASDCWYSCPKSADGSCNDSEMDECTCGADRHNRQLDRIIGYVRANRLYVGLPEWIP